MSRDAFIGPQFVEHLAAIHVMVGDYEAALDRLEYLLSIPSELSVPLLALDPKWDPLRRLPRFKALIDNTVETAADVPGARSIRWTPNPSRSMSMLDRPVTGLAQLGWMIGMAQSWSVSRPW